MFINIQFISLPSLCASNINVKVILTLKQLFKMKELIEQISALCDAIKADVEKSETNKAAAARVRKATLDLEKVGKAYRKASIAAAK